MRVSVKLGYLIAAP